jgi:hypothetical protein
MPVPPVSWQCFPALLPPPDAGSVNCHPDMRNRWVNGSQALWAQPARNLTRNLELSFGGAHAESDSAEASGIVALRAKRLLAASDDGAVFQCGIARNVQLLAEAIRDEPRSTKYKIGDRYIVAPDPFEA